MVAQLLGSLLLLDLLFTSSDHHHPHMALSVSPPATFPPPIDQGTHHPNTDHSHLLHTKGFLALAPRPT